MVDSINDPKDKSTRKDDENLEKDPRKSSGHTMFKHPQRVPNCRICVALETEGASDLFDNHISDVVTGCPKFQAMTADERRSICMRAKLCMKCCDQKIIFDAKHRRDCKVTRKNKIFATCVEHPNCVMHSWLCGYHKEANKSKSRSSLTSSKSNPLLIPIQLLYQPKL